MYIKYRVTKSRWATRADTLHFWVSESKRVGRKVRQKRVIGLGHVSCEMGLDDRFRFWQSAALRLHQLGDDGRLMHSLARLVPQLTRDELAIRDVLMCGAKNRGVVTDELSLEKDLEQ